MARCSSLDSFLIRYNPDYQREVCTKPEEAFFGDYPTLTDTRLTYGSNASVIWLLPQLYNLSEYCGCKDKLTKMQYEELAFVISTEYHYLKISELMLFFYRFKTGRYGRLYGTVDPLVITDSLRKFCHERLIAYDRREQQLEEQRNLESRNNAITYEEYLRGKEVLR